jgi:hypothetical protein
MLTILGVNFIQELGLVLMVLHKVGLYFVGAGPLVRAEWTSSPRGVDTNKVPFEFLMPSKGRLAIIIDTMPSAGRVTTCGTIGLLGLCRLPGLGGGGLNPRRIVGTDLVISKLSIARY